MIIHDLLAGPWVQATAHLDAFGLLGMTLCIAASLARARSAILLTGAAGGACFGLHYLGLGSPTGSLMCLISVAQNLAAARFARHGAPRWLVAAFVGSAALALALTASTWTGWPSGFAAAGALLATAARLQGEASRMRLLFVASTACWCGHDFGVGSACALACEALTMAGFTLALLRDACRTAAVAVPSAVVHAFPERRAAASTPVPAPLRLAA